MTDLQVRIAYDTDVWVALDPRGQEAEDWAVADATLCWNEAGIAEPDPGQVSALSTLLYGVYREVQALAAGTDLEITGFLHLPSPDNSGAVALLTFADDDGVFDRDDLAAIAGVGADDLVEPAAVSDVTTSLGSGIRVRSLSRLVERQGLRRVETVIAGLAYAWWLPEVDAVVKLQLSSQDLEDVVRAESDFDALAQALLRE